MKMSPIEIVDCLPLGPIERRIADLLAHRFGRWTSTEALIAAAYVGRRDGGPLGAKGCVKTHCHKLRIKLRRVGLDIEAVAWCGRRLIETRPFAVNQVWDRETMK